MVGDKVGWHCCVATRVLNHLVQVVVFMSSRQQCQLTLVPHHDAPIPVAPPPPTPPRRAQTRTSWSHLTATAMAHGSAIRLVTTRLGRRNGSAVLMQW